MDSSCPRIPKVLPEMQAESSHLDKGRNEAGYGTSKWFAFQGGTEIKVEISRVCGCKRSVSTPEYVPGSPCLPNIQPAQVTLSSGVRRGVSQGHPSLA